jgi:hypothetical protein
MYLLSEKLGLNKDVVSWQSGAYLGLLSDAIRMPFLRSLVSE